MKDKTSTGSRRKTIPEKIWQRTPPKTRYTITIAFAAISSIGDVIWAALYHKVPEAGRGGGFAAFLALFIVLVLPDFGRRKYDYEIKEIVAEEGGTPSLQSIAKRLDALATWIKIDNADRSKQTKALFLATAIGTFFWDLGDLFAGHLTSWFPHIFPLH